MIVLKYKWWMLEFFFLFWRVHIRYKCVLSLFFSIYLAVWKWHSVGIIYYLHSSIICVYSLLGCYKRHLPHSLRFILNLFLNLFLLLSLWFHIHTLDLSRTMSVPLSLSFFVLLFFTQDSLTVIFILIFIFYLIRYHNCPTDT